MKIALLQLNYLVGDFGGNAQRILKAAEEAASQGAELCIASELAIWGYPPRDLLFNTGSVSRAWQTLKSLAVSLAELPPTLVGIAEPNDSQTGKRLFNSAALLQNGTIERTFRKTLLPTYDVFDEDRYFEPANTSHLLELNGQRIGVTICEDIWNDHDSEHSEKYDTDPLDRLALERLDLLINLSGSPFTLNKHPIRQKILRDIATQHRVPVAYVNQVGGNDDLVFDGRSLVLDPNGRVIAEAAAFKEDILIVDTDSTGTHEPTSMCSEEEAWHALVLGVRDYMQKTGFTKALLGLSGGIDSALTAAIAAEAIGGENVLTVLMPSPYSSTGSIDDSVALVNNLGAQSITLPIASLMDGFAEALAQPFEGYGQDTTEENIQSRIRGNILMAISNKHRSLLLTTGNKSELSVGYCTIYGDMSGGLAVIADVPKTMVFAISRWLNETRGEVIPSNIITKPPSAELRPDQKDEDSLPAYDILDEILERHIEKHQSRQEIINAGFESEVVHKVTRLVKIAEFKRRQAAPGLKITDRAFGTGWRMPIASKDPETSQFAPDKKQD